MLYTVSELGNVTFLTILNWFRLVEPTSAYFQVPQDSITFPSEKFDLKKLYYKEQQSCPYLLNNALQIAILVQRTQHHNYVAVVYIRIYCIKCLSLEVVLTHL